MPIPVSPIACTLGEKGRKYFQKGIVERWTGVVPYPAPAGSTWVNFRGVRMLYAPKDLLKRWKSDGTKWASKTCITADSDPQVITDPASAPVPIDEFIGNSTPIRTTVGQPQTPYTVVETPAANVLPDSSWGGGTEQTLPPSSLPYIGGEAAPTADVQQAGISWLPMLAILGALWVTAGAGGRKR